MTTRKSPRQAKKRHGKRATAQNESGKRRILRRILTKDIDMDTVEGGSITQDQVLELAVALERSKALHIIRNVREIGFAKGSGGLVTMPEAIFDLACEEIEFRLCTEVWELGGISIDPSRPNEDIEK